MSGFNIINPNTDNIKTNVETSSVYRDASGATWFFGIFLLVFLLLIVTLLLYLYFRDPTVELLPRYTFSNPDNP